MDFDPTREHPRQPGDDMADLGYLPEGTNYQTPAGLRVVIGGLLTDPTAPPPAPPAKK